MSSYGIAKLRMPILIVSRATLHKQVLESCSVDDCVEEENKRVFKICSGPFSNFGRRRLGAVSSGKVVLGT